MDIERFRCRRFKRRVKRRRRVENNGRPTAVSPHCCGDGRNIDSLRSDVQTSDIDGVDKSRGSLSKKNLYFPSLLC